MIEPLVKLNNISKYYYVQKNFFSTKKIEVRAVDGISFSINPGETLGLVGESSCGKTTLAKLILRLVTPTKGEIVFGSQISDLRKDVQMVFQNPYNSLDPMMRIEDIILEPLLIHRIVNKKQKSDKALELLRLVCLDSDVLYRLPQAFSGGQRQRISLARAMATNPKIIILDEPVSSLDVMIQGQVLKLLKDLQLKFNLSFLFITHNLSVARNFCDQILVMYLGKIMERALVGELFNKPMHPYTESLILASIQKKSKLKGDISRIRLTRGCIFNPRCPYTQEKCFNIEPILEEKENNHFAYCHFPLKNFSRGEK
jgi:oligopeptide/dipeptide ABC transporter ATP-binding protein